MTTPYGYDIDELDAPKFVSRGEWEITGNVQIEAYTPLKEDSTLESGLFGVSGVYEVHHYAKAYDDISGLSGCIGVSLRKIFASDNTGLSVAMNQNIGRRKMAVLHEGYAFMRYQSGTLNGGVVTLRYGDKLAPCTSGFRVWQDMTLYTGVAEGTTGGRQFQGYITGGKQQCELGWYADLPSNATGYRKRVKLMPNKIYADRPA